MNLYNIKIIYVYIVYNELLGMVEICYKFFKELKEYCEEHTGYLYLLKEHIKVQKDKKLAKEKVKMIRSPRKR